MAINPRHNRFCRSNSPGMFGLLLACFLLVVACGCGGGKKSRSAAPAYRPASLYRTWFFQTPPGAVVGYPSHADAPHMDGKIRLSGYARMRVKGSRRQHAEINAYHELDSIFFYYDSTDTGSFGNAAILDSFFVSKYYVYLVSRNRAAELDTVRIRLHERPRPIWLDLLPESSTRLYAEGSSRFLYYDQASSWMRAEENALKELCNHSVVHFASLMKYYGDDRGTEMSETTKQWLDLWVEDVVVEERYFDARRKTCRVLLSCPVEGVRPFDESATDPSEPEHVIGKPVESANQGE